MKPSTRKNLEAMYQEHFEPRADGGLSYSLDDHIHQVKIRGSLSDEEGAITDQQHADALGLPVNYIIAIKRALEE